MAGEHSITRAGALLGFGLGGFFDGILLHQILQWHHLLSLVDGLGDLRAQVLADGLFHALMYLIALAGLVLLWRGRAGLVVAGSGRRLTGAALIGFGGWHTLDALLSHWLLGIHRIRIDSADPLLWDLAWLAAFGIAPALIGWLLTRKPGGGAGRSVALGLALAATLGGGWAARPPGPSAQAMIVFRPGMSEGAALAAIVSSGGRPLWASRGVWAVAWDEEPGASALYARGALLVTSTPVAAGCLAWSRG